MGFQVRVISFTGPHGVGNSHVVHLLEQQYGLERIRTVTTRAERLADRRDEYRRVTPEEFKVRHAKRELIFVEEYQGDKFGTDSAEFERRLELPTERPAVMVLLPERARVVWDNCANRHFIPFFLRPPNVDELRRRLLQAGETPQTAEVAIRRCAGWEEMVRGWPMPFRFVDVWSPESAVAQIVLVLRAQGVKLN